jgi:uncharacterized protein YigE (DUF2233 family)
MIKQLCATVFKKSAVYLLATLLLVLTLNACGAKPVGVVPTQQPAATITSTSMPEGKTYDWNGMPTPPVIATSPTFTPAPALPPTMDLLPTTLDTGWGLLQTGLERRQINIYDDQNQISESLYIFRLDQNEFQFDIAYSEEPKSLENWQAQTKAVIVINGGYFRVENEKYIPNGLTISGGKILGGSYGPYAGMLAISKNRSELRWLADTPYDPSENLQAALQSFPVLVKPVGEIGFPKQYEDGLKARRTVIGQDSDGKILFIVAPKGYFTLHQLSVYLTESDLNLDIAINLDGGPSSGVLAANSQEIIPAQTPLPLVIIAYAR